MQKNGFVAEQTVCIKKLSLSKQSFTIKRLRKLLPGMSKSKHGATLVLCHTQSPASESIRLNQNEATTLWDCDKSARQCSGWWSVSNAAAWRDMSVTSRQSSKQQSAGMWGGPTVSCRTDVLLYRVIGGKPPDNNVQTRECKPTEFLQTRVADLCSRHPVHPTVTAIMWVWLNSILPVIFSVT